jgi:hypothetical protein
MHSSLVLQDRETDTYWAIMSGEAIGGELKGSKLRELPVSEKIQWKDWEKKHPNTLVLSVNGREDVPFNPYTDYFRSEQGFRGARAKDKRLRTKEPIFAFNFENQRYAIPYKAIEGGKVLDLGSTKLFLYRPKGAAIFYSTLAFKTTGTGFEQQDRQWVDIDSGCKFDPEEGSFEAGQNPCPERFKGFDTFWYNWSLTNPDTKVLKN